MKMLQKARVNIIRQEEGNWLLWGASDNGYLLSPFELKARLFTWHDRSLYGTLLNKGTAEGKEGLILSSYTLMHYLAYPAPSLYGTIEWTPQLEIMKEAAVFYKECLEKGWYAPSYEHFLGGRMGWKPLFPEQLTIGYHKLANRAKESGFNDLELWFSEVVNGLIEQEPEAQSAWHQLLEEQAGLQLLDTAWENAEAEHFRQAGEENEPALLDEEDWLTSIGWRQDEVPFHTCLQLVEPDVEADESWKLQILLQDRGDTGLIVESDSHGMPRKEHFPEHWLPFIPQRLSKDLAKITAILPWLQQQDKTPSDDNGNTLLTDLNDEQAWLFLEEGSIRLLQTGYSVFLPKWWSELKQLTPKLKAKLTSSVGSSGKTMFGLGQLMEFDWKIAIGDMDLSQDEFMRMAAEKKRLMYIRGRWIQLQPDFLRKVQQAMKRVEDKKGLSFRDVLEMHLLGSEPQGNEGDEERESQTDPDRELQIEVELNRDLVTLMSRLQQTKNIPIADKPESLHANLRPYQMEGVSWLHFMRKFGLGCCLADDMGLGKTIQFITYLLLSKESKLPSARPALLICPTSVLGNWQKELERFAPSLNIYLHYGPSRAKEEHFTEAIQGSDLVLTSYNLAQIDREELSAIEWDCIGLDEAQNIKNAYTKQSAAIRRLKAGHRIALTGTPIENRLTELWSIFDFINPGYLGSLKAFSSKYVTPIEKNREEKLLGQVQSLIKPFLLRRVKKDPSIQLDLPEKNEAKAYVTLTTEQGALYENIVQELMYNIENLSGIEKKGAVLAALTKLKQVCDHPALFLKETGSSAAISRSNKMMRLLELVQELRAEGDNCLIFTQYVEMGRLLQATLEKEQDEPVSFLHGGIIKAKRDQMITQFQEQGGIFILSLRAGGTGLNLTSANHVFHFDRWWNPAVENQATDRAYRIGQTRDVQVHKFVTLGTLEERIDEMIENKQELSEQIVSGGENWITEMSTNELKQIFTLRKEWVGK